MKLPLHFRNRLSITGAVLASLSFFIILVLFALTYYTDTGGIYTSLLAFMILPVFLVIGLFLIPLGMLLRRRKLKQHPEMQLKKLPVIDFNEKRVRNGSVLFIFFTVIFVIATVIGSYEAYHYSESTEFCGLLCHNVMEPQYTSYQNSPHARVKCAECHIGPGAEWLVKSKLSGLRQIYKSAAGTYPRPIPTPVENLRPARETCEQCHWPQKFYPNKIVSNYYFQTDSANTKWETVLRMKTGPDHSAQGYTQGIHWHINPDITVEYKAADERREIISWVKLTDASTGEEIIYHNSMNEAEADSLAKLETRVMDCIDCHNRPSHNFLSPPKYVDNLLAAGSVSKEIPFIRYAAMEALNEKYSTKDSAFFEIERKIKAVYSDEYPEYGEVFEKEIQTAITHIQSAYSLNAFPYMKTDFSNHQQHIGHMETDGCFRCHNDEFVSETGRVISKDCNLCHSIMAQGTPDNMEYTNIEKSLDFKHPVDIGGVWEFMNCADCHRDMY